MPRHRKPRNLKLLHGTLQKCRDRPEVDFPPVGDVPAPPDWLISPDAVAEWDDKVRLLVPVRVLTRADLVMLGHYCNQHAEILRLYRMRVQGLPTPAPTAAQYAQLRMYADEFGFTPASRSKAQPARGEANTNPFSALTG